MPKGSKNSKITEKSSLLKSFKYYKNKGLKVEEIAKILNINQSTAKKISAKLKRKKSEKQRILEKISNPYIDLSLLGFNERQKDILYKSKEWLTQIKPLRVISELRNNPKLDYQKVIRNLNIDTLDALEKDFSKEWFETLIIREEFKDFKKQLPQIKKEMEEIKISADMYVCYSTNKTVNISDLKELKNLIPKEECYPLPKSITKRLMIPENIAIMHDAKYLQVSNDINILENKITKLRVQILNKYISHLSVGTKRLINIYFKNPLLNNELKSLEADESLWVDINMFFEQYNTNLSDENKENTSIDEIKQGFSYEEMLELENQAFVSGCGKRIGKMGSSRTGQKMSYAMNLLK